jgi:NAD(P)-dependent dehydrogenase (short-subunit alcohol dehydrogenase family)
MAGSLKLALELGPKGKRVVAVAPKWPGLARDAKTEDDAIERLRTYMPRYAPVAQLAGMTK